MFSWFKKKPKAPPAPPPSTPAAMEKPPEMIRGKVAFQNGERSWTEEFDIVAALETILTQREFEFARDGNALRLNISGYELRPIMIAFRPLDRGGSSTTSIVRVSHNEMLPEGLFEYQHSTGETIEKSLAAGLEQWANLDLPVLLDAAQPKPSACMAMHMTREKSDEHLPLHRRVLFGPVGHLMTQPPAAVENEEHPYCACCLFTRSIDAFKPLLDGDGFFALRLFAMRNSQGHAEADCRVNGEEFEPGKLALRKYVETWPEAGIEFRKQYVVIQNIPAGAEPKSPREEWRT